MPDRMKVQIMRLKSRVATFYISLSFQIEPAEFAPERLVLVCSLQVNSYAGRRDSIKSAPKSARSRWQYSRPARALIGQPSGFCRVSPQELHAMFILSNLISCSHPPQSPVAFHWALERTSPIAFPAAGSLTQTYAS
jgi:hypothetical protein